MVKIVKPTGSKKNKPLRKKPKAVEGLSLPTEKSEPADSILAYSMLVYGKKKIGKTSLISNFEDTMFLMCEPGGKALSVYQRPVRNWSEFVAYVDLLIEDTTFKTVAIDTGDFLYEFCMEYVCEKLAIEHPSDEAYGKGWKAVRAEFTLQVTRLLHSGKGVVFISHSKEEEFNTRRGDTYHKTVSSMPGQAKDVLEGLVDIWVNYDYDGTDRFLIIGGNDEVDAGHRLEGRFKYTDGTPVTKIPMGKSAKEGYENFMAAFNNELEKPEPKVVLKKKKKGLGIRVKSRK